MGDLKTNWLKKFKEYGVSENDYSHHENLLNKKFGKQPFPEDIVWSIFNEIVTKLNDLHELKMIFYQMALFLHKEGKDSFNARKQSAKFELLKLKQEGEGVIDKIEIMTAGEDSCAACRKLEKKTFTIDEALKTMPLPCKECSRILYKTNKRGFCRCLYVAAIEDF